MLKRSPAAFSRRLRPHRTNRVRLGRSLAAALPECPFEHPVGRPGRTARVERTTSGSDSRPHASRDTLHEALRRLGEHSLVKLVGHTELEELSCLLFEAVQRRHQRVPLHALSREVVLV